MPTLQLESLYMRSIPGQKCLFNLSPDSSHSSDSPSTATSDNSPSTGAPTDDSSCSKKLGPTSHQPDTNSLPATDSKSPPSLGTDSPTPSAPSGAPPLDEPPSAPTATICGP